MNNIGIMLFDIDGVIRSVENSYRLSLKKTVYKFCGWEPNYRDIDNAKNEGIWNNDWDLSLELIKRHIKSKNLKVTTPQREDIIRCFEDFYFGGNPNTDSNDWTGFIRNEELLVEKEFFTLLNVNRISWGFVSGAESASAKFVLEKRLKLESPPLIAMGDAPDKPDPQGFLYLASKLSKSSLGNKNVPIAYVGDTIADVKTVINARKEIPSQKFISIGVAPPHLHLTSRLRERNLYESILKEAGADFILNSVNDLKNIDHYLFRKM
ncbi:TIGR01548 family HAD-type hydrolase [Prochlorococcus sp. AH-716-K03]|nr:TIGR01548 family HAD-type hydrolase [Prochlorococcus sp. AH-716-K03]